MSHLLNIQKRTVSDKQPDILSNTLIEESPSGPFTGCTRYSCPYNGSLFGQDQTCWRLVDQERAFDLYKLIDDFCGWFKRVLDLRECSLSIQISDELPRYFQGNILMLGFLLWDVARYSLAYAGSGEAKLEIDSRPLKAGRYSICFILTMPGPGIPLEKEKLLFLPVRPSKKESGRKSCLLKSLLCLSDSWIVRRPASGPKRHRFRNRI